ncbi:MAG: TldD/PmbA family protein [Elusimicrobia bacterium]|nr:TldD/PmbA family protein [Elusimicrobiota bacterium]
MNNLHPEIWKPFLEYGLYSELYFESSRHFSIHWEDSRPEEILSGCDAGVGLRYLDRESGQDGTFMRTYFGSVPGRDPEQVRRLSRDLVRPLSPRSLSGLCWSRRTGSHPVESRAEEVPIEQKLEVLAWLDGKIREATPEVRQVSLSYGERQKEFTVLNSEGVFWLERRPSVVFGISVVVEKDAVLQTGREVLGAVGGFEFLSRPKLWEAAAGAARRAREKLSAPVAKAGEMPVVISSAAGGTLIHEAIGHSLEADHVLEGTSPAYRGAIGRAVAAENITVLDDPTLPGFRGSFLFDDEGLQARPTPLVERGILKDYLFDRLTAYRQDRPSNGHGRRESYRCLPIPRMSNLYIAPGQEDPAAILRSLKRGLWVTRMGGGQVNTATGEFLFEVEDGFWVEGGEVRHRVRDANLMGCGPEVLKSIDLLGKDLGWSIGTCGKEGQGVAVADGIPTLRISKVLVGGR